MKGKRFIVIMAIFLMLCSIQATTAFENNNLNQTDAIIVDNVQFSDIVEDSSNEQISDIGGPNNLTGDVANVELSHFVDTSSGISIGSSNIVGVNSQNILGISSENLLEISNEDKLGITAGTFIYGVDYDTNRAGDDIIPLDRFFKAIYWGIRDYMQSNPSATHEWNVFLNNKTFTGNYGQGGVGTITTGYLSPNEGRVNYLTFNGMNYNPDVSLIIHLYGGSSVDDTRTSTLDLSGYGANYALLDFSTSTSSITGINFKNFNVNDHPNTYDPSATTPFIKLGDKSKAGNTIDDLIRDCSFENIVLNPNQPLYEVGNGVVKDLYFSNQYSDSSLSNLIKFIFWRVRDNAKNGIMDYNIFLCNNTFTGGYGADGVGTISTGYYS